MKNRQKIISIILITVLMISVCVLPALAVTESEVQDQVNAIGKDGVTGNILVWFLCAIAFLKVSQKIDSFMSSLGINVGHTGGSMMSELIIAARGLGAAKSFAVRGVGGGSSSGGSSFMKGGLAGIIGRKFTNGAAKRATGASSGGLGGVAFNSSVSKGGNFANNVIGKIATGSISANGSISGPQASNALLSYMGYTALGKDASDIPSFSSVEIGGGHIFATETSETHPDGIQIGMYNTDQYMSPTGEYTTVSAADGTTWYKQYATDTVESKPYKDGNGNIAYQENIVQRLPKPPQRKDKI
jgi:hypothetical protein